MSDTKIVTGPEVAEDGVAFVVVVNGTDVRVTTTDQGRCSAHGRAASDSSDVRAAIRAVNSYVESNRSEMEALYQRWRERVQES